MCNSAKIIGRSTIIRKNFRTAVCDDGSGHRIDPFSLWEAATSKHEYLRRERPLSAAAERLRQVAAASTGRQRAVDNGIYLWEWNCTMPRSLCYAYGRTVKLRQCLHRCEVLLHDLHVALHHIILSRPRRYRVLFEEEHAFLNRFPFQNPRERLYHT